MILSNQQKTTLKTYVEADTTLNSLPHNADGAFAVAEAMNAVMVPSFYVWKSRIDTLELFDSLVWTAVDNLTVGKARIFEWMVLAGTISPENNSTRVGIRQCFGADSATEIAILTAMKRTATRLEALFCHHCCWEW